MHQPLVVALAFSLMTTFLGCAGKQSIPDPNQSGSKAPNGGRVSENAPEAQVPRQISSGGVLLPARDVIGRRIRTRRTMRVDEVVDGVMIHAEVRQTYVQEAQDLDEGGQATTAVRSYEHASSASWRAGEAPAYEVTPLEGARLRLMQRAGALAVEKLSGDPPAAYTDMLQIASFDRAFLPAGRVEVGSSWIVDGPALRELESVLGALNVQPQRTTIRVRCFDIQPTDVRLAIEWSSTVLIRGGAPEVFQLSGLLKYDSSLQLVSSLELTGGRKDVSGGTAQEMSMSITREVPSGWFE